MTQRCTTRVPPWCGPASRSNVHVPPWCGPASRSNVHVPPWCGPALYNAVWLCVCAVTQCCVSQRCTTRVVVCVPSHITQCCVSQRCTTQYDCVCVPSHNAVSRNAVQRSVVVCVCRHTMLCLATLYNACGCVCVPSYNAVSRNAVQRVWLCVR